MIGAVYSILVYLAMFALPAPGAFLPKVQEQYVKDEDRTITVIDKRTIQTSILNEFNSASFAPLSSFAINHMSYNETFMDR